MIMINKYKRTKSYSSQPGSVAQSDARSTGDQGGCEFEAPVRQHSFAEIDHEIFSTVIFSLPLIQEGKFVSYL